MASEWWAHAIRALPKLTRRELMRMRALLDELLYAYDSKRYSDDDVEAYDVVRALLAHDGIRIPPWNVAAVRCARIVPSMRAIVDVVKSAGNGLRRVERGALLRIVCRLCVRACLESGRPNLVRIAWACAHASIWVDRAFPGYRRAGLLSAVVRART